MLNSQQFVNEPFQKEKPGMTRSRIKCDVINSKPEIAPLQPARRKALTEHTFESLLGEKIGQSYQRIRRNAPLPNYSSEPSRTKERSFFIPKAFEGGVRVRIRGGSIQQVLGKCESFL